MGRTLTIAIVLILSVKGLALAGGTEENAEDFMQMHQIENT